MDGWDNIARSLVARGFADDPAHLIYTPLTGGVSSDICRIDGGHRPVCVKRARGRLAVEAIWTVPVERNHFEAEFLRVAGTDVPGFAPELLAEDPALGLIVLPYLDSADWHLWKAHLLAGEVDIAVARGVGEQLGRLAQATRGQVDLAARFDTGDLFDALRLDPYLRECARVHADLAPALNALIETTAARSEALVHGDVSPKNVLVNRAATTVVLDAECAWYGDPAFDLAFVLNHLLLKAVHLPGSAGELRQAVGALLDGRASTDTRAQAAPVQARATALLPGLLLARVDGKSPVEYLTNNAAQRKVRGVARRFLLTPAAHPIEIFDALTEGPTP